MISSNKICISNNWEFKENENSEKILINLPHTNKETPYNYFDEKMYQIISYYEKNIYIKNSSKRTFLMFEGVMTAFTLYVNGNKLPENRGGYIPHSIEITNYVKNGENKILVEVDSTERKDIPPFGFIIDYLTFGGIYRDVWQYELDNTFIKNIFFKYEILEHNKSLGKIKCCPIIEIDSKYGENLKIKYNIFNKEIETNILAEKGIKKYPLNEFIFENIPLWDIDNPKIHICNIYLSGENSKDSAKINLGFRDLKIEPNNIYLNGKKVKLIGLNRHQSFPYVGYAMPKRAQEEDAIILKNELNLNTVRCSHYPQSIHFLNKCDELGLLVLEEIPGWQHIGKSEAWQNQALSDVKAMIERDFNHPCIITWGVRINESLDNEELYKKTNALARELDDTRLTSGVRCYEKSQFLEDIYTMNDFCHRGGEAILRSQKQCTGLEKPVPYIVTEFCGHIYPTKKIDCEEKLVEHALRHARVQSKANKEDEILGAIGWCAFDYNTHFDFGSGDRICYHGVMDMFRMPKFASYVYKSQQKSEKGYILEPLTFWSRGEKNAASVFPIYTFTNCHSIELKLNGVSKGFFEREPKNLDPLLNDLPNPPIVLNAIDGGWGASWTDAEFIGYDSKGNIVANKKFSANPIYSDISVKIAIKELFTNKLDATRISVEGISQIGTLLPFVNDSIDIEIISNDIEIIGPKRLNLLGGSIAFWVRTKVTGNEGMAKIKIKSFFGFEKEIEIRLKKDNDLYL